MELDFDKRCQIEGDIRTIKHLLSLNPFYTISDIEIQRSILTRILICLRDLMYKSEHNAHSRVDFTEDVGINLEDKINDVTDLIKFMRDALCHEEGGAAERESQPPEKSGWKRRPVREDPDLQFRAGKSDRSPHPSDTLQNRQHHGRRSG